MIDGLVEGGTLVVEGVDFGSLHVVVALTEGFEPIYFGGELLSHDGAGSFGEGGGFAGREAAGFFQ